MVNEKVSAQPNKNRFLLDIVGMFAIGGVGCGKKKSSLNPEETEFFEKGILNVFRTWEF